MKTRIPIFKENLMKFLGKSISEDSLVGRGYFHVQDGMIINESLPKIKDIYSSDGSYLYDNLLIAKEEESEDDEDITGARVKSYLAAQIEEHSSDCWIKCIPADPEDVGDQEGYVIICLETEQYKDVMKISDIKVLIRLVVQVGGGWFSVPGLDSMESNIYEVTILPPETHKELTRLVTGRFLHDGFSLIGKPMPENKDSFHPNPAYSTANNSGYRNAYWHLSIAVDENEIIRLLEFSTYVRESSMFVRPEPLSDDATDAFDSILFIVDEYTDEEWDRILQQG